MKYAEECLQKSGNTTNAEHAKIYAIQSIAASLIEISAALEKQQDDQTQ